MSRHNPSGDSQAYRKKRERFDNLLTLFGRKPVLEALRDDEIRPVRLHFATSNRDSAELREMRAVADRRGVEIIEHTRETLARISKNGRQDQGVAIDIEAPRYLPIDRLLAEGAVSQQLIALDGVTNPQNLGMIVRSVAASPMDGLIVPRRGGARIDGLVIKASAGTLFKCRIYHCDELAGTLEALRASGYRIAGLDSHGNESLRSLSLDRPQVFILGNETSGMSPEVAALCDTRVSIPLANGVESLNVSIAAALVAFRSTFLD